ncbi:MAG TPA: molybdenum cofactor guanylyltransferase [Candidatus Limnocylindrales bacterium]|nr:molybdenum cofactor guanylyltransferase [Candidatus Limnocylindrales bacterium]
MTSERAHDTSAVVLAGGRSSRFGAPKLEAELEGISLLEHAIRAVADLASEIIVALPADPSSAEPTLGDIRGNPVVRFVRDPEAYGGPLVGLATALEATTGRRAIVVAGDMPRLRPAVLEAMLDRLAVGANDPDLGRPEAIVLTSDGLRRPLPVALRTEAARRAVNETFGTGERSLRAMLARLAVVELDPETWHALDPRSETLIDVDEPADLKALGPADRL